MLITRGTNLCVKHRPVSSLIRHIARYCKLRHSLRRLVRRLRLREGPAGQRANCLHRNFSPRAQMYWSIPVRVVGAGYAPLPR